MYIYIHIYIYTADSANERPVCEINTVYEGLLAGFTSVPHEKVNWELGYEPMSAEQFLEYETNLSLWVKTARLYKKSYYYSF